MDQHAEMNEQVKNSCPETLLPIDTSYNAVAYTYTSKSSPNTTLYVDFTSGFEFSAHPGFTLIRTEKMLSYSHVSTSTKKIIYITQLKLLNSCLQGIDLDKLSYFERLKLFRSKIITEKDKKTDLYYLASGLADQIEQELKIPVDWYELRRSDIQFTNSYDVPFIYDTYSLHTDKGTYIGITGYYLKHEYIGFIAITFPANSDIGANEPNIDRYVKGVFSGMKFIKPETFDIQPVEQDSSATDTHI